MTRRVVAIGWDGVDIEVVEDLLAEGVLPNVAALRAAGSSLPIRALPGLADDGTWATFGTGVEPGVHGRFHHVLPARGSYADQHVNRDDFRGQRPFWARLDDRGVRVRALDVPKSPMTDGRQSVEVTDWMVHGGDGPQVRSWPPEVASSLGLVSDATFECDRPKTDGAAIEAHRVALRARLGRRTAAVQTWLGADDWDLLLAVYAEGHCASHHFWHTRHDPGGDDLVREIVIGLDAALGVVLDAVGPDASVVLFSLVGMTDGSGVGDVVEQALERLAPSMPRSPGLASRARGLGTFLPGPLRRAIARGLPAPVADPLGRAARAAYPVRHDAVSTPIRLNVAGREPAGRVQPEDVDALCDRLRTELLALTDPADGRPICTEVLRVADLYPGPEGQRFADLLACWDTAPHDVAESPTLGRLVAPPTRRRSGNHRVGGWAVVRDAGVPAGASLDAIDVIDLPATIAAQCGVALDELPGRPVVAVRSG